MKFMNNETLPESIKNIIKENDYVGYVRVYWSHLSKRYGSRLFFNGAANGTVSEIRSAEERGLKRYTNELKSALQTVCEVLFEESNPEGRYAFYDFCKTNGFDKTEDGYMGYCYMAHSVFQIVVSKSDDYFCRVYFYDRTTEKIEVDDVKILSAEECDSDYGSSLVKYSYKDITSYIFSYTYYGEENAEVLFRKEIAEYLATNPELPHWSTLSEVLLDIILESSFDMKFIEKDDEDWNEESAEKILQEAHDKGLSSVVTNTESDCFITVFAGAMNAVNWQGYDE